MLKTILRQFSVLLISILCFSCGAVAGEIDMSYMEGKKAPEIQGTGWINSGPIQMRDLRGKVVLVDIWDYSSSQCLRTLPYLKRWHELYKHNGLVIIGVHAPEFEFGKNVMNVKGAVRKFGIDYPVVLDNNYRIWRGYNNNFRPRKFLIDKDGNVRHDQIGAGGYAKMEYIIHALLKEVDPMAPMPPVFPHFRPEDKPGAVCYPVTPGIYLGHEKGSIANSEEKAPGKVINYHETKNYLPDRPYAKGKWLNAKDAIVHKTKGKHEDYVAVRYRAVEANAVLSVPEGKTAVIYVTQDERPVPLSDRGKDIKVDKEGRTYLLVDGSRMYNIIKKRRYGEHLLKLYCGDEDVAIHTLTFVSCVVRR